MTNHTTAIVPLECWAFASPDLAYSGKTIDLGLFAESLIYYDRVLVNPSNPNQFAELLKWFIQQDALNDFFYLVDAQVLQIYEYSFLSTAIQKEGVYSLMNIQDKLQMEEGSFEKRFLYGREIESLFTSNRKRQKLYRSLRGNVIEVKADKFGSPIENARNDFTNARRNSLVIQSLVDDIYDVLGKKYPPEVQAEIIKGSINGRNTIRFNINLDQLKDECGGKINIHNGSPLTASAHSNRFIWSAATQNCDLFLPRPMSVLVGDKLYESAEVVAKSGEIIESLKAQVEYPDIRYLVNTGKLNLKDILAIRKKAKKFRSWLQAENDRDRDALIAYHNEVAEELKIVKFGRSSIKVFGILSAGALGGIVGASIAGPPGSALGGLTGSAVGYLGDVMSKINSDWKPVVFGNWLDSRIREITKDEKS